jgi:hypothetical protein
MWDISETGIGIRTMIREFFSAEAVSLVPLNEISYFDNITNNNQKK